MTFMKGHTIHLGKKRTWTTRGMTGRQHSEESKKKMSEQRKGKKKSEEWKTKIGKANIGKHSTQLLGRKPTEEQIKKLIGSLPRGEKHWNWKGGKTTMNHKIRNSRRMGKWRQSVFERDNYTCVLCGKRSGNGKRVELNADHIKPFALFPELRFEVNNGRTLCRDCHMKTDSWGINIKNNILFKTNRSPSDL